MRKLLWVGDAACPSGFAKSTHGVCDYLDYRANPGNPHPWDVTILGINYRGDPHRYPYDIFAAGATGDGFGIGRMLWMCDHVTPSAIAIQQDPWNFPAYLKQLHTIPEFKDIPVIGYVAVDGLNCLGAGMNGLSLAVFWTEFGRREARLGGYEGNSAVVPLGVDTTLYTPGDKVEARKRLGLPDAFHDTFIVGNVNRNQPRKRLDLTIRYFAEAWKTLDCPPKMFLYLHVAPTGESGYKVKQLAEYYGILNQLILMEPSPWYGHTEDKMVDTYRSFDIQITTTQGEGDGLTTKEGMACGIPQIVPEWSALGEWAKGYAISVPCTSTAATIGHANAIGGIADEDIFVQRIRNLYGNLGLRVSVAEKCLECARQPKFQWSEVGRGFAEAVDEVLEAEAVCLP
jgi:glycosyltransferase involved in cell wall biosynthesis